MSDYTDLLRRLRDVHDDDQSMKDEAAAAIEALQAQVQRQKDGWAVVVYRLDKELAAAQKDAARYRWLRRDDLDYSVQGEIFDTYTGIVLDERLDAAMAQEKRDE